MNMTGFGRRNDLGLPVLHFVCVQESVYACSKTRKGRKKCVAFIQRESVEKK